MLQRYNEPIYRVSSEHPCAYLCFVCVCPLRAKHSLEMFCCRQLSHYSQRVHSIPLLMCAPFCLLSASCLNKLLAFMPEHISGLRREVVPVQTAVCLRLEGDTLISFALFHALAAKQCFVTFLMHPKLGKDCCGPDVSVCYSVRAVNILCAGMYSMRGRSKKQQLHFFYCPLLKVQSNYFFSCWI